MHSLIIESRQIATIQIAEGRVVDRNPSARIMAIAKTYYPDRDDSIGKTTSYNTRIVVSWRVRVNNITVTLLNRIVGPYCPEEDLVSLRRFRLLASTRSGRKRPVGRPLPTERLVPAR